jgi:hypothetical protein
VARPKSKQTEVKTAQLPSGMRKLSAQRSWDPEEMPLLQGVIASFGSAPARDFRDGKWFPGKQQRFAKIAPEGDEVVYVVYESAGLAPLFDLGEGEFVAIAYTGETNIEGRAKPMRTFEIGVL